MGYLTVFKGATVDGLRFNVSNNLSKYCRNYVWVNEMGPSSGRDIMTGIPIKGNLELQLPKDDNLMDIENAVQIHSVFNFLTPLQARDARLWTRLSHVEFWEYMRSRWPVDKIVADKEKATRFVLNRYFVAQSQSRALLRNGIARLWWTANLSYDRERENPYELTSVLLFNLDITQQILERALGRAPTVIHGFLEFLLRNKNDLLTAGNINRMRIRELTKFLNLYGGVSILDCLKKSEVIDVLEKEFARMQKAEQTV